MPQTLLDIRPNIGLNTNIALVDYTNNDQAQLILFLGLYRHIHHQDFVFTPTIPIIANFQ